MNKLLSLAFLILLSSIAFAAVSSLDAKQSIQNTLLKSGEQVEISPLDVKIKLDKETYWIATVLSENKIVLFVPVNASTGLVLEVKEKEKTSFNKLFGMAYLLRGIESMRLKGKIVINQAELDKLGAFQREIDTQKNRLELMLADNEITGNLKDLINELIVRVDELKAQTEKVSSAMNAVISKRDGLIEANSIAGITDRDALKTRYESLSEEADKLIGLKDELSSKRDEAKITLFNSELSSEKKSNYGEWMLYLGISELDKFRQNINSEINEAVQLADYTIPATLYVELNKRIQENNALTALQGLDEKFSESTGYNSLKEAFDAVIFFEKQAEFMNKTELSLLKQNYATALTELDKGNYSKAIELAGKAKQNAIAVLKDGFVQAKQEPALEFITTLLFIVATMLVAAAALIYREKFIAFFKPKKEELHRKEHFEFKSKFHP